MYELTEKDKYIYNEYLKASRRGKPYKQRKNFDKLADKTYIAVKRLASMFDECPEIDIPLFFRSGFNNSTSFRTIESFKSLKAIKDYKTYIAFNVTNVADSTDSLEFTKKSFEFIYDFCSINNVDIDKYISDLHFIDHVSNYKVNIFALFAFETFNDILITRKDIIETRLNREIVNNLQHLRTQYQISKTCRQLALDALKQLRRRVAC